MRPFIIFFFTTWQGKMRIRAFDSFSRSDLIVGINSETLNTGESILKLNGGQDYYQIYNMTRDETGCKRTCCSCLTLYDDDSTLKGHPSRFVCADNSSTLQQRCNTSQQNGSAVMFRLMPAKCCRETTEAVK